MNAFFFLKVSNDLKKIPGLGISTGAEHTHETFRRFFSDGR